MGGRYRVLVFRVGHSVDSFEGSRSASVEKLPYTGAKLGPFLRALIPVAKNKRLNMSSAS